MRQIAENPYRVLGVFANSPKKDQVANKTKMAAFLRVGRSMTFPLDLKGILPEVVRTQETVDKAESSIALPEGQLKATQFWFVKKSPLDDIAFNHLFQGNIDEAMNTWAKQKNVSSLQNSFICTLIKGNIAEAINNYASVLYSSHRDAFCAFVGENIHKEEGELIDTFLSQLQNESVSLESLYHTIANPIWKEALSSKVVEPYIKQAEASIAKSKASKGKTPNDRKAAGFALMSDSRNVLPKLKNLLSGSNRIFGTISDKYAQEILQCGIDYFNALQPDVALEDSMVLQKYALSIAVGSLAKQRCQENVDILNRIARELPPTSIIASIKKVVNKIDLMSKHASPNKIEKARALIYDTKLDLQNIKNKVGNTNEWYLKISTRVCSTALSWVIDEVNETQNKLGRELQLAMNLSYTSYSITSKISECKSILDTADSVMTMIANCDYDSNFRRHFNEQRTAFNGIRSQINSLSRTSSSSSYGSTRSSSSYSSSSSKSSSSSGDSDSSGCLIWAIIIGVILVCANAC